VGEQVLLKLQPYVQSSMVNRSFPKLSFKYFGPYEVIEKIGSIAYGLQLPASNSIHHVFHVSQLKAFTPDHSPVYSSLPDFPTLDVLEVVSKKVIDRRLVRDCSSGMSIECLLTTRPDGYRHMQDFLFVRVTPYLT
jgi:hypothetical protein